MKIVDIATEIFEEAGNPTSTSIPPIAYWIRGKVGTINNLLFEDFAITNDTYEIIDPDGGEITPEAVSVIKQLYRLYDYELQIRANLNALNTDTILRVEDQGSSVTKVNRNEVSKTLNSVRKDEIIILNGLINAYRTRGTTPRDVHGDDDVSGYTQYRPYYRR